MSLPAGTTLGPYAIDAPLGAGGMGEVYRARDTRLGREVAVKVIAADSATDPERLARFEQEARAAAALNHPNILAVFDIGPGSATHGPYIVSELLEGETLGARLARGRLPVRTAIELATQVARALAAAHDKGIVHRDLKPDNIFVTRDGTAKVLDFGLAKLREMAPGAGGDASTVTGRPPTAQGAVMGTVGYMAPEQVRGADVDHRADIFAIGVTLYEMLAGQRAFRGDSGLETLNAILKSEPAEFETLGVPVPAEVARIVTHCLEKHPGDRFQSARDLAFHLAGVAGPSSDGLAGGAVARFAPRTAPQRLSWAVSALALALGVYAWTQKAPPPPPGEPTHADINAPDGVAEAFHRGFALSPDGRMLAFPAADDEGRTLLWLRDMATGAAEPLPGTDDAQHPFWSPDGTTLAFEGRGSLRRIRRGDPAPQVVARIFQSADFRGGAWLDDGTIVFAGSLSPLYEVPPQGGQPAVVLDRSIMPGARRFAWPSRRGRDGFTVDVLHEDAAQSGAYFVGGATGQRLRPSFILPWSATVTRMIWDSSGWLLHRRDGGTRGDQVLLASPPVGAPQSAAVVLADSVTSEQAGIDVSVSDNGRLVYRPSIPQNERRIVIMSRTGEVLRRVDIESAAFYQWSADGRLVATPDNDVWIYDLERGLRTRLTSTRDVEAFPKWAPDGRSIAYHTDFGTKHHVYRLADGVTSTYEVGEARWDMSDWDGRRIVAAVLQPDGFSGADLWMFDLSTKQRTRLTDTAANEQLPRLSPDGSRVAYVSDETGAPEVYVKLLPAGIARRVSPAGGQKPAWTKGGREIVYVQPDGRVMAVDARDEAAVPQELFRVKLRPTFGTNSRIDVTPDGERFLVQLAPERPYPLVLVDNWRALLSR